MARSRGRRIACLLPRPGGRLGSRPHPLRDVSPSGRLPISLPKNLADLPAMSSYPGDKTRITFNEGLGIGYRHYVSDTKVKPLFPSGLASLTRPSHTTTWSYLATKCCPANPWRSASGSQIPGSAPLPRWCSSTSASIPRRSPSLSGASSIPQGQAHARRVSKGALFDRS